MSHWRNASGRPLSSKAWLEAHHIAKLPERTSFTKSIAATNPRRIVDLGCGPGMWLSLFNEHAGPACELVGLDIDESAVVLAKKATASWPRRTNFIAMDIEKDIAQIPEADVFLAFNIFPYLADPVSFLEQLKTKIRPGGVLVVRQYDGNLLRFGPIDQQQRLKIESSLHTALGGSKQFRHYDLDRVFDVLNKVPFLRKQIEFELFSRTSPFPPEFIEYFENTVQWTREYVSVEAKESLDRWHSEYLGSRGGSPSYFVEVDLVAWMS